MLLLVAFGGSFIKLNDLFLHRKAGMVNWISSLNWWSVFGILFGMVIAVFGIRVALLWPHVIIQLDKIDKPAKWLQYLKLFVFYLKNPDRLQKSIELD